MKARTSQTRVGAVDARDWREVKCSGVENQSGKAHVRLANSQRCRLVSRSGFVRDLLRLRRGARQSLFQQSDSANPLGELLSVSRTGFGDAEAKEKSIAA